MLSTKMLITAIKNNATNEDIYDLIRLFYGKSMKKTYYSLLQRDKYYQELLRKTDFAEKRLNQQELSPEVKTSMDHFVALSDELEDEAQSVLYFSAFLDSYHIFKTFGLIN